MLAGCASAAHLAGMPIKFPASGRAVADVEPASGPINQFPSCATDRIGIAPEAHSRIFR